MNAAATRLSEACWGAEECSLVLVLVRYKDAKRDFSVLMKQLCI